MEKQDTVISFIVENKILDERALQAAVDQQQKTGQSLVNVLKNEHLIDEDQFTRIVATANKIEFINLSPEQVDPMVAHLVSSIITGAIDARASDIHIEPQASDLRGGTIPHP